MTPISDQVAPAQKLVSRAATRHWQRWALAGAGVLIVAAWFGGRQLWAWHHWREGRQAFQSYDFPDALAHFERCLRVWPGSVSVRLEAARAARREELIERAE